MKRASKQARKPRRSPRSGWAKRSAIRAVNRAPARPRADDWAPPAHNEHLRALNCRPVDQIKIGSRHRKDMGDVAALARDINERGLLQPIVITPDGKLIAGGRRLKAWQLSKFRAAHIPVHVVPLRNIVAGEWAENDPRLRKDFTPSEAVAIAAAIEAELKPAARERRVAGGKTKQKGGAGETARAADKAAAFTGRSRRSLDKAAAVVAAAAAEPAKYGKLKEDMDRTGRVDGPFNRLQALKASEQIRKAPPPVPGAGLIRYRAGVIDWPWAAEPECDDPARLNRGYYPYPTMSQAQIVAYARDKVRPILADDCLVAMWIPNFHLVRGYHVAILEALGLNAVTMRTWNKPAFGQGQVLRGQTEHAIFATQGRPVLTVGNISTRLDGPIDRKHHSRKPQNFYDDFVRLVAAEAYFTLFETADRGPRWHGHGDKAPAAPPAPAGKQTNLPPVSFVGLAGHSFTLTLEDDPAANVAVCECGVVYRTSRELPRAGIEELDKHIKSHWRVMARSPGAYDAAVAACARTEPVKEAAE